MDKHREFVSGKFVTQPGCSYFIFHYFLRLLPTQLLLTSNILFLYYSEWEVYSAYHQSEPMKYSFLQELLSSIAHNWKTGGLSLADVSIFTVCML